MSSDLPAASLSVSIATTPSVIKRPIRFSDRINEPRRLIKDPEAEALLQFPARVRLNI